MVQPFTKTTFRAPPELFARLEAYRRRIGARSLNEAMLAALTVELDASERDERLRR